MLSSLWQSLHALSRHRSRRAVACRSDRPRFRPEVFPLEDRRLLAAVPLGPDFVVPTTPDGGPSAPDVAVAPDGGFVVAWNGGPSGILARRYDANSVPLGPDIPVFNQSGHTVYGPRVGVDATGDFVVAWNDSTGSNQQVFFRSFHGAVGGTPQPADSHTTDSGADVAMAPDGRFAVTWQQAVSNGSTYVAVSRFDASGNSLSGGGYVTSDTSTMEQQPTIAMAPTGQIVVAWEKVDSSMGTTVTHFTTFNADGSAGVRNQEAPAIISVPGQSDRSPAAAMNNDGSFTLAWEDGQIGGLNVRRFDATGAGIGFEKQGVPGSADPTAQPHNPDLAASGDGRFVLAYFVGEIGLKVGLAYQEFSSTGARVGGGAVNTTDVDSGLTTIAVGRSGDKFVFAFTDHAGDTIRARVFETPVPPVTPGPVLTPLSGDVTGLVTATLTPAAKGKKGKGKGNMATLTIHNNSGQPLQGPLDVVLRGLKKTVKVRGAAGFVGVKKKKSPFIVITLSGGTLAPQGSVSMTIQFSGKPNAVTLAVFAGAPPK
jgi:hypothetical protein